MKAWSGSEEWAFARTRRGVTSAMILLFLSFTLSITALAEEPPGDSKDSLSGWDQLHTITLQKKRHLPLQAQTRFLFGTSQTKLSIPDENKPLPIAILADSLVYVYLLDGPGQKLSVLDSNLSYLFSYPLLDDFKDFALAPDHMLFLRESDNRLFSLKPSGECTDLETTQDWNRPLRHYTIPVREKPSEAAYRFLVQRHQGAWTLAVVNSHRIGAVLLRITLSGVPEGHELSLILDQSVNQSLALLVSNPKEQSHTLFVARQDGSTPLYVQLHPDPSSPRVWIGADGSIFQAVQTQDRLQLLRWAENKAP